MENIDLKQSVKGIIFDYGGTIDSRGVHWSEIIWDGYRHAGVPVDKETFREAYVFAERELARTRHILPGDNFHDLLVKKMKIELDHLAELGHLTESQARDFVGPVADYCYSQARASIEEARPVLEQLAARYPMVLVSNFYGNVDEVLRDFDLRRYFGGVIESAVVGVRKPDARIFSLGVVALGLEPAEVLVIGDSLRKDILPARSIGCATAWLKGKGWTAEEDAATDPSMITRLADVTAMLD